METVNASLAALHMEEKGILSASLTFQDKGVEREIVNISLVFQHTGAGTWTESVCVDERVGRVTLTFPSFLWVLHMEVGREMQCASRT